MSPITHNISCNRHARRTPTSRDESLLNQPLFHVRVQVSNIPSGETGNAASCAEHAIYLALALLRDQHQMAASIRDRRVGVPLGQTLLGKTALLIGFGNIAKELVPRYSYSSPNPGSDSVCSLSPDHIDQKSKFDALGSWPLR